MQFKYIVDSYFRFNLDQGIQLNDIMNGTINILYP